MQVTLGQIYTKTASLMKPWPVSVEIQLIAIKQFHLKWKKHIFNVFTASALPKATVSFETLVIFLNYMLHYFLYIN